VGVPLLGNSAAGRMAELADRGEPIVVSQPIAAAWHYVKLARTVTTRTAVWPGASITAAPR